MSASGNVNLQSPPTPLTSFTTDDGEDELFALNIGNPTQIAPGVPGRCPQPMHIQQLTPIPETPESPTPGNFGQCDTFHPYNLPDAPTISLFQVSQQYKNDYKK